MSISVLVVEDHAELRTQLCELLQKEGYDVRSATTVEEAIATLSLMPPPCLVLWDPVTLRMSVAPGWELKAWIKGFLPHVRMIKPASLRDEIVRDLDQARRRLGGGPGSRESKKKRR